MAIYSLNSGSISPMFICIGTKFGIRQQHRLSGVFRTYSHFSEILVKIAE